MKSLTVICSFMVLTILMITNTVQAQKEEYGTHHEQVCSGGVCTLRVYQIPAYFELSNGSWQRFNTSFKEENCNAGSHVCVKNNLYEVQAKRFMNSPNSLEFEYNGLFLGINPVSLSYNNGLTLVRLRTPNLASVQEEKNKIFYEDVFGTNVSVEYIYTPYYLKQNLILESPLPAPTINGNITLDYTFNLQYAQPIKIRGVVRNLFSRLRTQTITFLDDNELEQFFIMRGIAYDDDGNMTTFDYEVERNLAGMVLTMKVPYEWLGYEGRKYPILVDPTVYLDNTTVLWDGYVEQDAIGFPATWTRFGGQSFAKFGRDGIFNVKYRTAVTWNTTLIPDYAQLLDFIMELTVTEAGDKQDEIRMFHMLGDKWTYSNNQAGNQQFFNDMGQGQRYLTHTIPVPIGDGAQQINFTNGTNFFKDFEERLRNGDNNWTIGIRNIETSSEAGIPARIATVESGAESSTLTITYLVPTIINLIKPENQTYFSLSERGNILLNWSVQNEELNNTVIVYGDNETPINKEYMLFYNTTQPNLTRYEYNWSRPLIKNKSDTLLLYHFDNNTFFNESQDFFYDFSGNQRNGMLVNNVEFNFSNEVHAGNLVFTGGDDAVRIKDCNPDCVTLQNMTFMSWIKTEAEGTDASTIQGIFNIYTFPNIGFSIYKQIDFLVAIGDSGSAFDASYFTGYNHTWLLMTVTMRDNGTMDLYRNEEHRGTGVVTTITQLSGVDAHVGRFSNNIHLGWIGAMDDFVIYNFTIEPEQIKEYFQLEKGQYYWEVNATTEDFNLSEMYQFNQTTRARTFYIVDPTGTVAIISVAGSVLLLCYNLRLLERKPRKKEMNNEGEVVIQNDMGD